MGCDVSRLIIREVLTTVKESQLPPENPTCLLRRENGDLQSILCGLDRSFPCDNCGRNIAAQETQMAPNNRFQHPGGRTGGSLDFPSPAPERTGNGCGPGAGEHRAGNARPAGIPITILNCLHSNETHRGWERKTISRPAGCDPAGYPKRNRTSLGSY